MNTKADLVGSPHESPDTTRRQAAHSPLPWKLETWQYGSGQQIPTLISQGRDATAQVLDLWCMDTRQNERDANAALIVRSVNHADKLAECLEQTIRDFVPSRDKMTASQELILDEALKVLKAYEVQ